VCKCDYIANGIISSNKVWGREDTVDDIRMMKKMLLDDEEDA